MTRIELGPTKETRQHDDEVRGHVKLEGLTESGLHAGGVVIAPGKLTDFTALLSAEDGSSLGRLKDDVSVWSGEV